MADTAAHLVDRVFPRVPVRQWVLSFPHALRYRLAYDSELVTDVLRVFIADDAFQFPEPHAVLIGQSSGGSFAYRTSRSCMAFHNASLPMIPVSMTRFGRVTDPFSGSISPVKILIKGGLAGTIRPGDGITTSGDEGRVDVFEQNKTPNRIVFTESCIAMIPPGAKQKLFITPRDAECWVMV